MMNLTILIPHQVFCRQTDVSRIVADTSEGSFGLLPHRLDCVAVLVPGIFVYEAGSGPKYVAVDGGVLVKSGTDVRVSVRRAIAGTSLDELRNTVRSSFLKIDAVEHEVRLAMIKMEAGMLGQFAKFKHAR